MPKTGLLVFYFTDYRVLPGAASIANTRRRMNLNLEWEFVSRLRILPRHLTLHADMRLTQARAAQKRPNQGT